MARAVKRKIAGRYTHDKDGCSPWPICASSGYPACAGNRPSELRY